MAAQPQFTVTPQNGALGTAFPTVLTTAANDVNGTNANNALLMTAGSNGSFLRGFRLKALGSNATTKLRLFLNNGSTNGTATNNAYIMDFPLAATSISTTAKDGPDLYIPLNMQIESGFRIYGGLTITVSAGWQIVPIYGDY